MTQASRRGLRALACALVALAALGGAACGDDEERATTTVQSTDAETATTDAEPETAETAPPAETTDTEGEDETEEESEGGSPEDQPGGAGDEVPARSQALISGRGGRLSPRLVRVPPFIAIRVELRSEDGAEYVLRARGRRLVAGGDLSSVSTTFAGLRPGDRLVLEGPQGRVAVEASAEPGP